MINTILMVKIWTKVTPVKHYEVDTLTS